MKYDLTNRIFKLAFDLVSQSSRNIFLTGKAGTGKTTFLKYIRENCHKQMAVLAPTGVAAINAGGVTIHSFFQLPFGPFLPETAKFSQNIGETVNRHNLISRLRIGSEKIKVFQQLELLVIDEVSMVRCDTMDAIDTVLRHFCKRPLEKFGGVQLLFIGDMFQLPPVVKEQEWNLLQDYYNSPYFFDSEILREEPPVYIEFDKIYRQNEEDFIRVLNQVRNNGLDISGRELLDKRVKPGLEREKADGYIVLTTHNEKARNINTRELNDLNGTLFSYRADIKDDFPENAYPADEVLHLKVGAQVMFIKNDSDKSKRFFNGKIGIVTALEADKIIVQCKDEADEIEVNRETWENIRYTTSKGSTKVEEEVLGSFSQYPLRLAWAITIHKSQGLTFEKAIIDAGEAFAAGQVYVALSRCTNLDGMILKNQIKEGSIFSDKRIVQFSQRCLSQGGLEKELTIARNNYQAKLIVEAFDLTIARNHAEELSSYLKTHSGSFNAEALSWMSGILDKADSIQATAVKFHSWLHAQFRLSEKIEENNLLQTKTRDGAAHFIKEIETIIHSLQQSSVVTDSRIHAKEFNDKAKELFNELSSKALLLKEFEGRFEIESWHKRRKTLVIPSLNINAYAGSSEQKIQNPHPQLYYQLKKVRDGICFKKDQPIYRVASSSTLDEMARFLPQNEEELLEIKGFGKARVATYGKQFLEVIIQYCRERGLVSCMDEKRLSNPEKEATPTRIKGATKAESFRLYKEGRSIAEIAKARNFTVQTIEGHLAHYVEKGQIHINELVSSEKVLLIESEIAETNGSMTPVKERLGNSVSYGEIRLVLAWQVFKNSDRSGE